MPKLKRLAIKSLSRRSRFNPLLVIKPGDEFLWDESKGIHIWHDNDFKEGDIVINLPSPNRYIYLRDLREAKLHRGPGWRRNSFIASGNNWQKNHNLAWAGLDKIVDI